MATVKPRTQPDQVRAFRQPGLELATHVVNLAFDGIARNCALGPPFGNHGTQPHRRFGKQGNWRNTVHHRHRRLQHTTMQSKVRCFGKRLACQNRLELGPSLQSLHGGTSPNPHTSNACKCMYRIK
jgi:hypothetical protein